VRGIEAGANDFVSRPFDPGELGARVNSQLAVKQARDELAAEQERIELLYLASQLLNSQLDYQAIMGQIAALTTALTQADKSLLVLLDESGNFREKLIARRGHHPQAADTIEPRVLSEGLLGWVIAHQQPVLLTDVVEDSRWAELADDDPSRCAAAVPLVYGTDLVGVLLVTAPEPGTFRKQDVDILSAIGNHAAMALANARLYQSARQQRARTAAILNSTGDPVVVTNTEGRITDINPAARRILRLSDDDLGRTLRQAFSLALEDLVVRARERHSPVSGEYTLRNIPPDEHSLSFNVSVSPVEQVGFVLVWQDITGLKEGERVRLESERVERQRILGIFSRYMSSALVERVLGDKDILTRRERREAIVLFADLRGFTRLTVEHLPDNVIALLNDVFSEMMEIIYAHEGIIFDIAGDELMIAFNVPYDQPDASQRAVATAVTMQREFVRIKKKWAERGMQVGMGIGLNRGPVVLGHVGGSRRMNYAMVGETVNVAHRFVEMAQDGQVIAPPAVIREVDLDWTGLTLHELPPQVVKGTTIPQVVMIIERTQDK
jgi:PAS domain S-box-containing protein